MTKNAVKKITIVVIIIALIAVFKSLQDYLTLSYLKGSWEKFALLYAGHRASVIVAYMVIYIVVTTLSLSRSLPGSWWHGINPGRIRLKKLSATA